MPCLRHTPGEAVVDERVKNILLKQAAPFLKEGEVVRHVFQARRGENPWVAAWSTMMRFPRLIVVTDTAILVLSTRWLGKPDSVMARLDRTTRLGEPQFSGWSLLFMPLLGFRWIRVNNERLWVRTGDLDEVRATDAELLKAA
jgi:hypothetical protein